MEDFSASKACAGFESISQYANNLFTKPWRKEYKTVKVQDTFIHSIFIKFHYLFIYLFMFVVDVFWLLST